jgi:hypothetical protein
MDKIRSNIFLGSMIVIGLGIIVLALVIGGVL